MEIKNQAILFRYLLFFYSLNVFPQSDDSLVKNINGYKAVLIGDQIWMSENLAVNKFSNGAIIPQALTAVEWEQAGLAKKPAWCYFKYDPKNAKNGKYYNYYAVSDPRGLAPKGWHIPDSSEWMQLVNYLGPDSAGVKLKSKSGWNPDLKRDCNGTNSTGFNGKPVGFVSNVGLTYGPGYSVYYWARDLDYKKNAWYYNLWYPSNDLKRMGNYARKDGWSKKDGASVRCIKDTEVK